VRPAAVAYKGMYVASGCTILCGSVSSVALPQMAGGDPKNLPL
jgi:hypothetical protein